MHELTLKSETKSIRFVISENGWCQLYFHDGSKALKLGANDEKTVFSKLILGFLCLHNRNYFTYSGMEMFTIMNIMDSHATIAGREINNTLELLFLNPEGQVMPLMYLSEDLKSEWITQIISFLTDKKCHST